MGSSSSRHVLAVFTFAGVVVAGAAQLASMASPYLPALAANAITVVGVIISVITGALQFSLDRDTSARTAHSQPTVGRRPVSSFWIGATIALVLLAMAIPAVLILALFTGFMAFRKERVAAGIGAVVGSIVLLVALVFIISDTSSEAPSSGATVCVTPFGVTCPLPPGPIGAACHCGFYDGTAQ